MTIDVVKFLDDVGKDLQEVRMAHTYAALKARLDKGTLGQQNFQFSKVEIEGLMGLLSGEFEGGL